LSTDVLIVGGGLSGLMAARVLREQDIGAVVVEKSKGAGGRMATRWIGPGRADHGAQFFTVRTPEFEGHVKGWLDKGLAFVWSLGWSGGSLACSPADGHPRYAIYGGMNALAQHLAEGLEIQVNSRLTSITAVNEKWRAETEEGAQYESRALLLTPPVPQSLELLDAGQTNLSQSDRTALERVEYDPCLTAMFWLRGMPELPAPGALQRFDAAIQFMADNHRKGISPEASIVTAQASPAFSRQLWDKPDEQALEWIEAEARPHWSPVVTVEEAQLKRWRYAQVTVTHPERFLAAEGLPPLLFAGDAFGGPRIEGAALSGLAAGQRLLELLQPSR
jgi:predicted NAD/FAD-dependent oxidoreductase